MKWEAYWPKTDKALLWCEKCHEPTRHEFHENRGVRADNVVVQALQVFACDHCKTKRHWGFVGVSGDYVQEIHN